MKMNSYVLRLRTIRRNARKLHERLLNQAVEKALETHLAFRRDITDSDEAEEIAMADARVQQLAVPDRKGGYVYGELARDIAVTWLECKEIELEDGEPPSGDEDSY